MKRCVFRFRDCRLRLRPQLCGRGGRRVGWPRCGWRKLPRKGRTGRTAPAASMSFGLDLPSWGVVDSAGGSYVSPSVLVISAAPYMGNTHPPVGAWLVGIIVNG